MNSALKPNPKTIGRDALAGLIAGIAAIPDGMASAVLAGVNPVYGLYNLIVGTPVAALTTSSAYMAVINTSATALVVFGALEGYTGDEQIQAMLTLTVLVGLFQLALWALKLGYLTRFISNSVMTGFLTGIAIIIILSQLGDFTGYAAEGANKVAQTIDLLRNLDQVDMPTVAVGIVTLVLIGVLDRTHLSPVAMLVGLVAAVAMVRMLNLSSVTLVGDLYAIPGSLPRPGLPSLGLVPELFLPAVAVGIVGLVQAAGVSQGYPNPDGKFPDPNGDFRGQGLANVMAGFFQGLPLGGSVSGTALVVNAGAQSRWANFFTGLIVAAGVLLFSKQIEGLPMTALAAILIYAGFQTIKPDKISAVWNTTMQGRVAMAVTFLFTLFMPVQQAIFLGVALQTVMVTFQYAEKTTIMELVPTAEGDFHEQKASRNLSSEQVTMLLPRGGLFFASASDFEEEAPSAEDAKLAVVVLIVRARQEFGSTFTRVLIRYAGSIKAGGGQLILADVSKSLYEQLLRTGMVEMLGEENILVENPLVVASLRTALAFGDLTLAALTTSSDLTAPERKVE